MGSININGWSNVDYSTAVLEMGADNVPPADEYMVVVPLQDDERIVSFGLDAVDASTNWIMEVANGDPTQTLNVLLVGGAPAQDPPEIVLPAGFTAVRIAPGRAQRIIFITGVGWVPLFGGTLVA